MSRSGKHWIAAAAGAVILLIAAAARAEGEREISNGYRGVVAEVNEIARSLENRILENDVKLASKLYRLEMKNVDLLLRNSQLKFDNAREQDQQTTRLRSIHADILVLQERLLDHTLDELDKALPGEPTRDLWARVGIDLYRPLFRSGTPDPNAPPPTRADGERVLDEMKDDFLQEGGSFDRIKWLGPNYIVKANSGELIEWVQLGERIRLTAAGAKHPVIADGASVRGAGSLKIYKDAAGEVLLVVVSNSSGNYKPGIGSVFGMTQKLEELGIPRDRIIETRVLPGEPVLFKLLLKSKKTLTKEQIDTRVAKLKDQVRVARLAKPTVQQLTADAVRGLKPTGSNARVPKAPRLRPRVQQTSRRQERARRKALVRRLAAARPGRGRR